MGCLILMSKILLKLGLLASWFFKQGHLKGTKLGETDTGSYDF